MSARLNMNPIPYLPWKGQTLNQITTAIKKNTNLPSTESTVEFMRSRPIKHYRKEKLTQPETNYAPHNARISIKIDEFDRPNGTTVTTQNRCNVGITSTIDMTIPKSMYDTNVCVDPAVCREENAKRRVRSSGMNKPRYDTTKTNNPLIYCSDTRQYLATRNKTFEQNSYHYIRTGENTLVLPGAVKPTVNYYPGGTLSCPKAFIPNDNNNNFFGYVWIASKMFINNGNNNVLINYINIPTGYYTIEELNQALHQGMAKNGHYIVDNWSGIKIYTMNLVYNEYYDKIELQSLPISTQFYPAPRYSAPDNLSEELTWFIPSNSDTSPSVASLYIAENNMSDVVGFVPGYYPNILPWLNLDDNQYPLSFPVSDEGETCPNIRNTAYAILSNKQHHVFTMYKTVQYKPNNKRFATQGGVSSSARTLREKYDTVTTNGMSYFEPNLGHDVSNALSYGVTEYKNTIKSKLGSPIKSTPIICPGSQRMVKESVSRHKNMYNG